MKSPALLLRRARRQLAQLDETLAKLELEIAGAQAQDRPLNGRWSSVDDAKMLHMIELGVSHERIAAELGRTTLAVSQRASRHRRAGRT